MKIRRPWLLPVWIVLTGLLWWFVWYWKVNRELRDAFALPVGPFLSVLAVTVGWGLVFPPFLSWWRTLGRIEEAQRRVGVNDPIAKPLGFLLFFTVLLAPVYAQTELNRVWRTRRITA
jgi:hypothetical protein